MATSSIHILDFYRRRRRDSVLRAVIIACLYAAFSVLYIVYSSWLASHVAHTPGEIRVIETLKGVVFVVATAGLIFLIVLKWSRRVNRRDDLLIQLERKAVAEQLNGTLVHNLNNLLMSLQGLMREMDKTGGGSENERAIRAQLERGTERVAEMAKGLARQAAATQRTTSEVIDLRTALDRIVQLIRNHPDLHKSVQVSCRAQAGRIRADYGTLEQAVINLALNAAQAAGRGGKVEIRAGSSDHDVWIEVHDNGPGVPAEIAATIFDAGFTTKPEGTGLGLLSVSRFANLCGGTVTVERSPLGGALFRITLPGRVMADAAP